MALPVATPPLLLTKRLNAFLHASQTSQLPTLLLTTHHGKLLAHASPHPVSILRTHATVASSLLAIHTSSSVDIPSALPGSRTPDPVPSSPTLTDHEEDSSPQRRPEPRSRSARPAQPVIITVQLTGGTLIIRSLKCGLLFVCVGPSVRQPQPDAHLHENGDLAADSPSEVESFVSAAAQSSSSLDSAGTASVVAMRRHAADLARWLDEKLGSLRVPEEGVGSSD